MKKLRFFVVTLSFLSTFVWLALAPVQAESVTRHEETDTAIVYSPGVWIPETTMPWSGGRAVYAVFSPNTRAQAAFTFSGTGVDWIGYRGRFGGIVLVRLDGNLPAVLDTYSATEQVSVAVYSVRGLAPGIHSLMIELTGARNPLAI